MQSTYGCRVQDEQKPGEGSPSKKMCTELEKKMKKLPEGDLTLVKVWGLYLMLT